MVTKGKINSYERDKKINDQLRIVSLPYAVRFPKWCIEDGHEAQRHLTHDQYE